MTLPKRKSTRLTNSEISKFVSMFKRYCNKEYPQNIWQRPTRDENDYREIWEYIDTNAYKWEEDCFYNKKEIVG